MPIALKPFDASRDFISRTSFRAGGRMFTRGQPFDKSLVNTRVLEQIYTQRKIAYDEGPKLDRGAKRVRKLLSRFVDAVLLHTSGAPGTAREAPGASESTDATSGSASAPSDNEEAATSDTQPPPPPSTDTTVDASDGTSDPGSVEAAVAPVGEAGTTAADARQAKIDELMIANSQKELLELAKDLPGIKANTPKAAVAAALVDAGRTG